MKLTTAEADVIRHRLEAPDAIYDVLTEDHGLEMSIGDLETECELLMNALPVVPDSLTEIQTLILSDVIRGNLAYVSMTCDDHREPGAAKVLRAGRSAARKIGRIVGKDLEFPEE